MKPTSLGNGLHWRHAGVVEPVKGGVEAGLRLGVGKAEEDEHYTAAENVVRKRLDIEVAAEENADQALRREVWHKGSPELLACCCSTLHHTKPAALQLTCSCRMRQAKREEVSCFYQP